MVRAFCVLVVLLSLSLLPDTVSANEICMDFSGTYGQMSAFMGRTRTLRQTGCEVFFPETGGFAKAVGDHMEFVKASGAVATGRLVGGNLHVFYSKKTVVWVQLIPGAFGVFLAMGDDSSSVLASECRDDPTFLDIYQLQCSEYPTRWSPADVSSGKRTYSCLFGQDHDWYQYTPAMCKIRLARCPKTSDICQQSTGVVIGSNATASNQVSDAVSLTEGEDSSLHEFRLPVAVALCCLVVIWVLASWRRELLSLVKSSRASLQMYDMKQLLCRLCGCARRREEDLKLSTRLNCILSRRRLQVARVCIPIYALLHFIFRQSSGKGQQACGQIQHSFYADLFGVFFTMLLLIRSERVGKKFLHLILLVFVVCLLLAAWLHAEHYLLNDRRVFEELLVRLLIGFGTSTFWALVGNVLVSCALMYMYISSIGGQDVTMVFIDGCRQARSPEMLEKRITAMFRAFRLIGGRSGEDAVKVDNLFGDFASEIRSEYLALPLRRDWSHFAIDEVCIVACAVFLLFLIEQMMTKEISTHIRLQSSTCLQQAFSSTLDILCDCVVCLRNNLDILGPAPRFGCLLLSRTSEVSGSLLHFMASEDDCSRVRAALLEPAKSDDRGGASVSGMLHVDLRDAVGTKVSMQLFHTRFSNDDGELCFVVGMNEVGFRSQNEVESPKDLLAMLPTNTVSRCNTRSGPSPPEAREPTLTLALLSAFPYTVLSFSDDMKQICTCKEGSEFTTWLSESDSNEFRMWLQSMVNLALDDATVTPFSETFFLPCDVPPLRKRRTDGRLSSTPRMFDISVLFADPEDAGVDDYYVEVNFCRSVDKRGTPAGSARARGNITSSLPTGGQPLPQLLGKNDLVTL